VGATLALAYAQTYTSQVTELILRGIFLLRPSELHWLYQQGANILFPDVWQQFVAPIPTEERGDILTAFYKRLTSNDPTIALIAARAWSIWEAATSYLIPNEEEIEKSAEDEFALAIAKIECHYFVHNGFLPIDNQLIKNVSKIHQIPTVIVQARYDMICPMLSAWELHTVWPQAKFRIVPNAGHSAYEAGTIHELVSATNLFR
jgi:proline iminopeptidase